SMPRAPLPAYRSSTSSKEIRAASSMENNASRIFPVVGRVEPVFGQRSSMPPTDPPITRGPRSATSSPVLRPSSDRPLADLVAAGARRLCGGRGLRRSGGLGRLLGSGLGGLFRRGRLLGLLRGWRLG